MTRYWCHICNSYVHVNEADMKCVTCDQDFIEAVEEEEPAPTHHAAPAAQDFPHMQQAPVDVNNIFGQLFQTVSHMLGNADGTRTRFTFSTADQPSNGQPPFVFYQQAFNPQFAPQAENGPQQPQGPNEPAGMPFGHVFNLRLGPGSLQDLLGGLLQPQQFGDYVSDAGMASLLDRLFRQHQSTQHPASKAFVEQLPVKKFTEENCEGECAICKCDWTPGEQGLDLPCHHVYHSDCIQKWFETSNRCPMCRYEVPTDDPEYERQRKAKEAEESQNSDPLHADQSSNTTQTHASSSNATNNHGASLNTSSAPPTRTTNGHTSSSSSSSSVQLTASQEALIADLLSEDSNSAVSQEPSSDHNTSQDFSSEYSMSQHPASYYSSSQDFMNSQSHDPSSEYSTAEDEEGEESSSSAFHSPTSPQSPMSPTDQPYEPNYSLD